MIKMDLNWYKKDFEYSYKFGHISEINRLSLMVFALVINYYMFMSYMKNNSEII